MTAAKKIKTISRPNIFSYVDYRSFLKDQFEYLKAVDIDFSMSSLARKIGVSASYFTMIIKNNAFLSDKVLLSLDKNIGLKDFEYPYLFHLVHLNDAKNLEEQKEAFKRITKSKFYKNQNLKGIAAHKYFSSWHYIAIREMSNVTGFQEDPQWIQIRLEKKVSLTEIREAITFLKKYGYLKINDKKVGKAVENIECEGAVFKLALTEYYRQIYELGIDSIYKNERSERHHTSHTVAIRQKDFDKVKEVMNEAIQKVKEISNESDKEDKRVYHLSLLSFPMTKESEPK